MTMEQQHREFDDAPVERAFDAWLKRAKQYNEHLSDHAPRDPWDEWKAARDIGGAA